MKTDEELFEKKEDLLPGSGLTWHKFKEPTAKILQTFKNPASDDPYDITFTSDELTALCPLTGYPDQYILKLTYKPNEKCIESKSAKFYLGAFRDYGGFIERVANKIYDDWFAACDPFFLKVELTMNPRGGIGITVVKEGILR